MQMKKSNFIAVLALATLLLSHAGWASPTRISVLEFSNDPGKVAAYKKGIESMRKASLADQMSPKYRTSFAYWSNTHGYFGSGTHATNMKDWIAYRMPQCLAQLDKTTCDRYYAHMKISHVPDDGYTDGIWGTCQHGNLNFLPWHRLYMNFYEKTLRLHSGDNQLAVPYWNYFDETNPRLKGLALPELVRGSSAGTLYNEWRTIGLNNNTSAIDPTSGSAAQAFKYDEFIPFSNELQGQPHGVIHCAVGTNCATPDLGFVPIAGLDPLFYMHHSNIDRLWQCWLNRKAGGATIDLAWAKANLGMPDSWYDTSFTFVNEYGAKVVMTIADVFKPGVIDVRYDDVSNCAVEAPEPRTSRSILQDMAIETKPLEPHSPMTTLQSIDLVGKTMSVSLQPQRESVALLALPQNVGENGHTILSLKDITLVGTPSLTYKIFLSNKNSPDQQVYIATFNLFSAGAHGGGHAGHGNKLSDGIYNVTDHIRDLGIESAADVVVNFEPSNLMTGKAKSEVEGSGIKVGAISLQTIDE
jgi:hypothetical protein